MTGQHKNASICHIRSGGLQGTFNLRKPLALNLLVYQTIRFALGLRPSVRLSIPASRIRTLINVPISHFVSHQDIIFTSLPIIIKPVWVFFQLYNPAGIDLDLVTMNKNVFLK